MEPPHRNKIHCRLRYLDSPPDRIRLARRATIKLSRAQVEFSTFSFPFSSSSVRVMTYTVKYIL